MTAKTVFSGTTHNTPGANGAAVSSDGFLDLKLSQPHPAAENLFGAAWSACYQGAIEIVAAQRKITLPEDRFVDARIDLNLDGGAYVLAARLDVGLPGLDRDVAETVIHAAHEICPYSKAVRGNIAVETNLI
ncbi:Ohr family peroxiredoxin [Phenylobacterium sp.]|uniref:Ohr family peroxiredoxin n=1 Tax=Phenylobacterium sp. TaxID=1871053 RepID=UPI002EDA0EEE